MTVRQLAAIILISVVLWVGIVYLFVTAVGQATP